MMAIQVEMERDTSGNSKPVAPTRRAALAAHARTCSLIVWQAYFN